MLQRSAGCGFGLHGPEGLRLPWGFFLYRFHYFGSGVGTLCLSVLHLGLNPSFETQTLSISWEAALLLALNPKSFSRDARRAYRCLAHDASTLDLMGPPIVSNL